MTQLMQTRPTPTPAGPRRTLTDRLSGGVSLWAIALVVAAVTAVVHARGMYTAPIRFDDEGTYMSQALAVLTEGSLSPYTYWYDHPPLGWVIIAAWMAGPGLLLDAPHFIGEGRQFMLVLAVISSIALVFLARRIGLSRSAAAATGLLFALSPLAIAYHRMVLLDNIVVPLVLTAFVLALNPRKALLATFASGVLMAAAVLVKLTAVLLAPFLLWVLWRNVAGPTRRMSVTVFLIGGGIPALLFPMFALIKGELFPRESQVSLWEGLWFQVAGRPGSGSIFTPGDPAHEVVTGWLSTDPYLVPAGVVLALVAVFSRRLRPFAAAMLLLSVMLVRPGYLPMPYVVMLLPFAALLVAGVVDLTTRWLLGHARSTLSESPGRSLVSVLAAITVVAMAAMAALPVAQEWRSGINRLASANLDLPYSASTQWLVDNIEPGDVLVVDNVTWTDLVNHGLPQDDVIWFSRLDNDPAVQARVGDWRNVDWVVSTDVVRNSPTNGELVRDLLVNSTPVASWGSGPTRIVVGRVNDTS
jgi:4-amino-4-deoxy-L-arabinose transferase-like glycosyltransferase